MALQLHDTLRGKKVPFEPLVRGPRHDVPVRTDGLQLCPYRQCPAGRRLRSAGSAPATPISLTFARNITDVDDKINAAATRAGKPIGEITERYIKIYNEDMAALGVQPPDIEPRATEHIE